MTQEPIHNTPSRRSDTPAAVTVPLRPVDRRPLPKRMAAAVRRWARETFNREQFVSALKSLVWVAPLTLLIWIYAEREQQDDPRAQFQVEVRSGSPGQVVRLADESGRPAATVTARLRGPKAAVGVAVENLRAGAPVQVVIEGARQPGLHDIDILQLIERDPRLRDAGASVVECQPQMLRVEVDTLQEQELDVKVDPNVRRLLNGDPLFDPPKVRVSAPSSAFQKAKPQLHAVATLPQEMLTTGRHGPVNIRVTVPGLTGPDVTLRQSSVMATYDVGNTVEETRIPSLPVYMVITDDTADAYRVTYPKFVQGVRAIGSPERIRQLEAGQLSPKPEARFSVTAADALAGKGTKRLEYFLPEGITIREEDKQDVTFQVTRREGTP